MKPKLGKTRIAGKDYTMQNVGFHLYLSADKALGKPEKLTCRVSAYADMKNVTPESVP